MEELKLELKRLIIETLKLEDVTVEEITDEQPLFQEGLELDSIDALELTVALEKRYNISIESEEVGKKAFGSINTLAVFVAEHRKDL